MQKLSILSGIKILIPLALVLALASVRPDISAAPAPQAFEPSPPLPSETQPGEPQAPGRPGGGPTYQDQLAELVNEARWDNGQLPPLKRNDQLDQAADDHSANMALRDFFAHCDLDTGQSPWDRMQAAGYTGYSSAGENIAAGYGSPAAVMSGWMGSSGHRGNILSTSYREIGVGYFYEGADQSGVRTDSNGDCQADGASSWPYYHYWTQNFGRRSSVYPVVINREAYETTSRNVVLYLYGQGWADEMRFCNSGGSWSAWQPFTPDVPWTLVGGTGPRTVLAEIRSGGTVYSAHDSIELNEFTTFLRIGLEQYQYLPFTARATLGTPTCSGG